MTNHFPISQIWTLQKIDATYSHRNLKPLSTTQQDNRRLGRLPMTTATSRRHHYPHHDSCSWAPGFWGLRHRVLSLRYVSFFFFLISLITDNDSDDYQGHSKHAVIITHITMTRIDELQVFEARDITSRASSMFLFFLFFSSNFTNNYDFIVLHITKAPHDGKGRRQWWMRAHTMSDTS